MRLFGNRGRAGLWLTALVAAFSPLEAGEGFRQFSLSVPGRVQDLILVDLDEDGRKDLFVPYVEGRYPNYTRGLAVFFQTREGFSAGASQTWTVDERVALVDVGQVDGKPGLDIVSLGPGGVDYYPLVGRGYGRLTHLVDARPFMAFADADALPYYDFLRDWNGDGEDDLLVLEFQRALFFAGHAAGLSREGRELLLQAQVMISIGGPERIFQEHHSLRAFYFLPQLNSADYDGDGLLDLIGSYQSELDIFRQLSDRSFSREPAWRIRLNLPEPPAKEGKTPRGERNPPMLLVADVNQDGKMDLIASQLVGGFGDLKSQTFIYYSDTDALPRNHWDQVIQVDQASSFPLLRDLDGDGSLDLIIPYVSIDILSIAKMILTTSLEVRFKMFVLGRQKHYPALPTAEESTSIKVNFRELTVEGGVPNVDGDFDGDGVNDCVVGRNGKELQILRGLGQGAFAEQAFAVLPIPAPLFPQVADLNADGLADLAVSYLPFTEHDHRLFVFLNTGQLAAGLTSAHQGR